MDVRDPDPSHLRDGKRFFHKHLDARDKADCLGHESNTRKLRYLLKAIKRVAFEVLFSEQRRLMLQPGIPSNRCLTMRAVWRTTANPIFLGAHPHVLLLPSPQPSQALLCKHPGR